MTFISTIVAFFLNLIFRRKENAAVKADRNAHKAEVAEKVIKAERAANEADDARTAKIDAANDATRKALDDAKQANPEIRPASPIVRGGADSLRRE